LQKSEFPTTYEKMMKVVECMENDSMHKKAITPLISQFITRVNIESVAQAANSPKRGQKRKWDKNQPKDKRAPTKKKPQDVAKVQCFDCEVEALCQGLQKGKTRLGARGVCCKGKCGQVGP